MTASEGDKSKGNVREQKRKRWSVCVFPRGETDSKQEGVCVFVCEGLERWRWCWWLGGGGISWELGLSFYDMIGCVRKR